MLRKNSKKSICLLLFTSIFVGSLFLSGYSNSAGSTEESDIAQEEDQQISSEEIQVMETVEHKESTEEAAKKYIFSYTKIVFLEKSIFRSWLYTKIFVE